MVWSNGWNFDVTNASHRRSFSQFIDYVRRNLGVDGVVMQEARRLPPQQDSPQFQDLTLSAGERTVVLRLRTDNLYVIGFRNAAGQWFRFLGVGNIPGIQSEAMAITGSYVGAHGLGGLEDLHLSSHAVEDAVSGLDSYAGGNVEQLKAWLRTLIVSFIESSRFTTVAATVATAMGGSEQVLSNSLIGQIRNWSSLSNAVVLAANRSDRDPAGSHIFTQFGPACDIRTAIRAAAALGLVLMEMRRGAGPSLLQLAANAAPASALSDDAVAAYGITVLEVLSVVIVNIDGENPGDLYGTVRVRDSFGTVDLFSRERSDIQSVRPGGSAELLWPGRAISAADDFVIDLNLMDRDTDLSPDDEVSRGEVVWVPRNAVSSECDVIRKALVTGKYGSAEVSYAVVTNAVVATMEVLLIDGDGESTPDVYGTVTAGTLMGPARNRVDYDLFWRERSDDIGVPKNTNIPLLRRVITAVWDWPLTVNVDLWDKDTDLSPDDQIAAGSVSFQFQPTRFEYSEAKQVTGRYGKVEVHVTWSLSHDEMK